MSVSALDESFPLMFGGGLGMELFGGISNWRCLDYMILFALAIYHSLLLPPCLSIY